MATCPTCNTTILFGGRKKDGARYCSTKCLTSATKAGVSKSIPAEVALEAVARVLAGPCPLCGGAGPVDVFTSHRIASFLVMTSWRNVPRISCRRCGTKRQLAGLLYSTLLGWWGFPWGLVMTPVQITKNLVGLARRAEPSPRNAFLFEALVREELASRALAAPRDRAA